MKMFQCQRYNIVMFKLNLTYFFFTVIFFTVIITVLAFRHNQLQSVFNSKNEKQLYLENKSICKKTF